MKNDPENQVCRPIPAQLGIGGVEFLGLSKKKENATINPIV
jgi:hypothetical protein